MKKFNISRKVMALLLCISLLAAMLVPTASAENEEITYTMIHNEDELKAIADDVSGNYKLANDITLFNPETEGESNWTALNFTGKFDGADHTISNLQITNGTSFFGDTDGATISNLTLEGTISSNSNQANVAAFCSTATDTTLSNCVNCVNIKVDASDRAYVGAFAGRAAGTTLIENCTNFGTIDTETASFYLDVGGICGYANANAKVTILNCVNQGTIDCSSGDNKGRAAGIIGYVDKCTISIKNCTNDADVNADMLASGICGFAKPSKMDITNCKNLKTITSSGAYAAGILVGATGKVNDYAVDYTITSCSNVGNVSAETTGEAFVGGIFARSYYNNASSKISFSYCYNGGEISAPDKEKGYVGGIAGSEGKFSYTNCYTVEIEGATGTMIFGHGESVTSDVGNAVLNKVAMVGTQVTKVDNGKYAVRFVSIINSLNYYEAGYTVSATMTKDGKTTTILDGQKFNLNTVYSSLKEATEAGAFETLTAPYGTYFLTLGIYNIPADAKVEFTITPYTVETQGADPVEGDDSRTVTYVNGILQNN